MIQKKVVVNDRMQQGYVYYLTEPEGENFDPLFRPELTPSEMLELGVFGGKYMTDCRDEFPAGWFDKPSSAPRAARPGAELFRRQRLAAAVPYWRQKGWIYHEDPRGWFQWYCRYYMGRRGPDDARRSGDGERWHGTSPSSENTARRATLTVGRSSDRPCSTGRTTAGTCSASKGRSGSPCGPTATLSRRGPSRPVSEDASQ